MKITYPDGSSKDFPNGSTGEDIARSISEGLLRNSAAIKIKNAILDLKTPIIEDAEIKILTLKDQEGIEILRHSAAHLLALAVKRLYPQATLGIGPAIEDGFYYDFGNIELTDNDIQRIEIEVLKIIKEKIPFELSRCSKKEALSLFKDEPYKLDIIKNIPVDQSLTLYKCDSLLDLCKGPHLANSSMIKAFKLFRLAGAYWKGDSNNTMLTRIYGTAFSDKKQLNDYLELKKKAEANDHVKLGKELDLFITDPRVGKGLPLLTPDGATLKRVLVRFVEDEEIHRGYEYTATPYMASSELFKVSGHWDLYKKNMFIVGEEDENALALRPMTCPHQFVIYNRKLHSYRDLPIRYAETSTLFRNEVSGSMHGLMRVRQFTLSEGHIICTPDQLEDEFEAVLDLINYIMKTLDLTEYTFRFSKWDPNKTEKYIDNPHAWQESESILKRILDRSGMPYVEEIGEAAFYGPKLDIQMKNVWGKEDTAITVQIDYALPERFNMKYLDKNGEEQYPIIIHRSSIGCYERTIALLIEKFGGKFPFWLAPTQIIILTINDNCHSFAQDLQHKLNQKKLRSKIDSRSETLKKKVRDAQVKKIPVIITIGSKEVENNSVSIRTLDGTILNNISVSNFILQCLSFESNKSSNIVFDN